MPVMNTLIKTTQPINFNRSKAVRKLHNFAKKHLFWITGFRGNQVQSVLQNVPTGRGRQPRRWLRVEVQILNPLGSLAHGGPSSRHANATANHRLCTLPFQFNKGKFIPSNRKKKSAVFGFCRSRKCQSRSAVSLFSLTEKQIPAGVRQTYIKKKKKKQNAK